MLGLLLEFWKPIAALVAIIVLTAAISVAKHRYDEARRDEGRAEVQAKFNDYKAAQDRERAAIIANYVERLGKLYDDKIRSDAAAEKRRAILGVAVGDVVNTAWGITLPADVRRVFDASSAAANARLGGVAAPDGGQHASSEAVPAPAEAAIYDERDLAAFVADAGIAYDDAVGLMIFARGERDACREARSIGGTP